MKKIFSLVLIVMMCMSCTSDNDFETGKMQLESQGYTEVENTGYNAFCCSRDEQYSTGFSAKSSKGKAVTGCFCSENFKGVTIRFEN